MGPERAVLSFELTMKEAKKMPGNTEEEKEYRKNMIRLVRDVNAAKKAIKKYYADRKVEFDSSVFEKLYADEYQTRVELDKAYKQIKGAKKQRDTQQIASLNTKIKMLRAQNKAIQNEIKKASDENSIYYRAAKPYLDAQRIIQQSEQYTHLDEIKAAYDSALLRINKKKTQQA